MELAFAPGTILLGKYRVESVIGRGGMGMVLRVTHLHLGEELAIKVLVADSATVADLSARFLREAQAAAKLRGEHVVRVVDIGLLAEGPPYMVMEYLQGVDLSVELLRRKPFAVGEAVDYLLQACDAIAEAHSRGIVHRDIKPANLFLTARPNGTPLIKVLDFGISKAPIQAHSMTRTDVVMGTVGYMSPEQMKAAKDVDARTDIWALGIVLYEFLTGRQPFAGESYSAVVLMAGTEPPPPMDSRIPRGLQNAVLRCLEKDRRARFATVSALVSALAPFAKDLRTAAMIVDSTKALASRPGSAIESSGVRSVVVTAAAAPIAAAPVAAPMPVASSAPTTASGGQVSAITSGKPKAARLAGFIAGVMILTVIVVAAIMQGGPPQNRNDAVGSSSRAAVVVDHADAAEVAALPVAPPIDAAAGAAPPIDAVVVVASPPVDAAEIAAPPIDATVVARAPIDAAVVARAPADAAVVAHAPVDAAVVARAPADATLTEPAAEPAKHVPSAKTPSEVASKKQKEAVPGTPMPSNMESPTPTNGSSCDEAMIEVWNRAAADQYNGGYSSSALALINKALACSSDIRLLRLGATYACAAHDADMAKRYYAKVPPQFRPAIEQKCQQEGTDLGISP